jgi:acyl-CoA synthetase (AMP-forming)/AMP-acid ligase II
MTLADIARRRAADTPARRAFTFLSDGDTAEVHLTYGALDRRARAVAAVLNEHGARGERTLLLFPPGLDFIVGFFGCLYGRTVAVPAYLPPAAYLERGLAKLLPIVRDASPLVGLTTAALRPAIVAALAGDPDGRRVRWLATDAVPEALAGEWSAAPVEREDLAFLQYTSGSTAAPKGVMVGHANLTANAAAMMQALGTSPESQGVCWLPLYHDMGLVGSVVQPVYAGFPTTLLSPLAFLQRPIRWLQAISRFKATISGAPNFAYELSVAKIDDRMRRDLDLSSWQVAVTGAEPVRAATLAHFARAFASCGFKPRAFLPSYGLAESTLMVSAGNRARPPAVLTVDAAALERGAATVVDGAACEPRTLVGCGQAQAGHDIRIVDPKTHTECVGGAVGEIWVKGPSVTRGYWKQSEATGDVFGATLAGTEGAFLRTGDLGFLHGDELFVTGRLKDLIIISGRNHYPQDIEETVQGCHPAISGGTVAAFSDDVEGEEHLIVMVEFDRVLDADGAGRVTRGDGTVLSARCQAIVAAVRRSVAETHDVQAHDVVVLRPGAIPKTSSGKLQRHACRDAYRAGRLQPLGA